jgi:hypothetical protein
VACRNPMKIPAERLFELDRKLYLLSIVVEGYEQESGMNTTKDDDEDDQGVMMILMIWVILLRRMLTLVMLVSQTKVGYQYSVGGERLQELRQWLTILLEGTM